MDSPFRTIPNDNRAHANPRMGLSRLIVIDVRNLVLLRIGLAVVILVDIVQRIPSLSAFLSESGVLTRELNQWLCPFSSGFWSLYWLNGSTAFSATLLIANALAALALLLGWQTRWAVLACLILAYSVQMRNPLILTAGHVLLRMLLFWSLFLPLGAAWSIDSQLGRRRDPRVHSPVNEGRSRYFQVVSIATLAIMMQVAMMYFFSGIAKWNEIWLRGDALAMALQLDMYVRPSGRSLLQLPQFLMMGTFLILILETVGPFLLWMPPGNARWRIGLMIVFWMLHVGIWLSMSIGIFSAVGMLSWVVFLPPEIWQTRRKRNPADATASDDASEKSHGSARLGFWPSLVCGAFLVYVVAMNVANIDPQKSQAWFGRSLRAFGHATMTLQQFKMFDRPAAENLWWRLIAEVENGRRRDCLLGDSTPIADLAFRPEPTAIYDSMPNQMWRRLLFNLATIKTTSADDAQQLEQLRDRAGKALLARMNQKSDTRSYQWICVRQPIFATPQDFDPQIYVESWKISDSLTAEPVRSREDE